MEPDPMRAEDELAPEDQLLWERLSSRLARADAPHLVLGEDTVAALEALCPPLPLSRSARARVAGIAERAQCDTEFQDELAARGRTASLGDYLLFLRKRAGLSLAEIARKYRLDFQWLGRLERDALSPGEIPGRALAFLFRRLTGSREQTEALLAGTLREAPLLARNVRTSLYRAAWGADRAACEAASRQARGEEPEWEDNPEYLEQRAALERLRAEFRAAWRA